MKRLIQEIYISIVLIIISIVFYTLFQFNNILIRSFTIWNHRFCQQDIKSFFTAIFSGVFASAFVVLILAIREYKFTKKESLSEFYSLALDKQRRIVDLLYLEFDEPLDLILKLMVEEKDNVNRKKYNKELIKQAEKLTKKHRKKYIKEFYWDLDYEQQNKFMDIIWDKTDEYDKTIILRDSKKDEYLKRKYIEIYDNNILNINNVIESYAALKNLYCDDLTKCISQIDFFLPCKLKSNIYHIYKNIYSQTTVIRRIGTLCEHYMKYRKYDELFLLHYIIPCQCSMIDRYDNGTYNITYNRYAYEIDVALWELLGTINSKQVDEKPLEKDYWVSKNAYLKPYEKMLVDDACIEKN